MDESLAGEERFDHFEHRSIVKGILNRTIVGIGQEMIDLDCIFRDDPLDQYSGKYDVVLFEINIGQFIYVFDIDLVDPVGKMVVDPIFDQ